MGLFGVCARIDGVPCGLIVRDPAANGKYQVVFERESASIEQIEAINWAAPSVEAKEGKGCPLPEGYGFEVVKITYDSNAWSYAVELKTARQYLGDVTGYQAQVEELTAGLAARQAELDTLEQAAAAKEAEIAALHQQLAEADELAISLYEAQAAAEMQAADPEGGAQA